MSARYLYIYISNYVKGTASYMYWCVVYVQIISNSWSDVSEVFWNFVKKYLIQHCFICCPSDFTMTEDDGMEYWLKVSIIEKRGGLKAVSLDRSRFKLFTLWFSNKSVQPNPLKDLKLLNEPCFCHLKSINRFNKRGINIGLRCDTERLRSPGIDSEKSIPL